MIPEKFENHCKGKKKIIISKVKKIIFATSGQTFATKCQISFENDEYICRVNFYNLIIKLIHYQNIIKDFHHETKKMANHMHPFSGDAIRARLFHVSKPEVMGLESSERH